MRIGDEVDAPPWNSSWPLSWTSIRSKVRSCPISRTPGESVLTGPLMTKPLSKISMLRTVMNPAPELVKLMPLASFCAESSWP